MAESAPGAASGPSRSHSLRLLRPALAVLGPVLSAYAEVLFVPHRLAGALFALATFIVPEHGLAGLLGLLAAEGWARIARVDSRSSVVGLHALNGALVGLALGHLFRMSWPLVGVLLAGGLIVVLIDAALRRLIAQRDGALPVLSLPFVLTTWLLLLAATRFSALELTVEPILAGHIGEGILPAPVELYLRSLGAMLFQLNIPAGLLILLGLVLASRWAVLLSVLGFTSGSLAYLALGGAASDLTDHFVGLNFIAVAIGVGGTFVVPSAASLLLAAGVAALTGLVASALLALLSPLGLPVLAFPFILVTQVVLYALALRSPRLASLRRVVGVPSTPEDNVTRAAFHARRYPDAYTPSFFLPVHGEWLVTQGFDGEYTHQGAWAHAWDFEVAGEGGSTFRGTGRKLQDYLCWGAPVVAPADGTVVRVVNDLADNPIGEVDIAHNWGNLVILWHGGLVYSAMCHLQQGSVNVQEGQGITRGQVLGKVGSSGRAPVPHLHFQAQVSPEIGASTLPARFLHHLVGRVSSASDGVDSARDYVSHGVPSRGERVRQLSTDEAVRRMLVWPPGSTRSWRVLSPAPGSPSGVAHIERTERWESRIDPLGARELVSDTGARLGLYVDPHYLTTFDYVGPSGDLLAYFHLATPRIPHLADPKASWVDVVAASPWVGPLARTLHPLARPFVELGAIPTRTRSELGPRGLVVTTTPDWAHVVGARRGPPDRLEVVWRIGGPCEMTAWSNDKVVLKAEVIS